MKILLVNVFRHKGSTGQIITNLGNYLQARGDQVIYAFREGPHNPAAGEYCIGRPLETALTYRLNYLLGNPYGGAWFSTIRLVRLIKAQRPDLISFHSINGSYINIPLLLKWLGKQQIPVTFTHHSEYLYTGNCVHSNACNQWIEGCANCTKLQAYHLSRFRDTTAANYRRMKQVLQTLPKAAFISVSPWVFNRARQSALSPKKSQYLVLNGISEQVFYPQTLPGLRERLAPNQEKIVLFSSVLFSDAPMDLKGGHFVLEIAKQLKGQPIKFIVVALETRCNSSLPDNLLVYGAAKNKTELAQLYSVADVLLLTSFRETYSMPTAESLMCGTPVVGFEAGGPESVALEQYSSFVKYGDVNSLVQVLLQTLQSPCERSIVHAQAAAKYGAEKMGQSYRAIFEKLTTPKE